ncbi:thiol-disulfide oxidoreductase DCC family protein [Estrella lausannensis]|uniref:Putative thiol-disulphide oxidoreductase n=1 Tax=Estrella lausannensis TaxID=483423 RepID=A0A0H5E7Y9_9BACT|nr:DUF393 domain-containing protein [Estrella lausannensis]CRX39455.1 Putative thiol-disulphide oxidoreductase [Estrella lausannensis]
MKMSSERWHLIFYDGTCGFCDLSVQFVMRHDKKKKFFFAPLQGKTAEKFLRGLPQEIRGLDSVILIEDFQGNDEKIHTLGKAAFRVLWLLGGGFALPGLISFLPSCLYNFGYRFIARRRHYFGGKISCVVPDKKSGRFLP